MDPREPRYDPSVPVPTLAQLIADVESGPPACWPAVHALGELAQPEANAYLATLFVHPDTTVRRSAVIALGANPANTDAIALLEPLLGDDDRLVRHHAAVALHRLRSTPWSHADLDALVDTALAAHRAWWDDLVESEDTVALVTLHDLSRGVPALDTSTVTHVVDTAFAMLKAADPVVRVFGIRLLRELRGNTNAAAAFVDLLRRETDDDVISWCIAGLGFQGTADAIDLLAPFVAHRDAQLRYRLAAALSSCALPTMTDTARDGLLALADDENDDVRYAALYELSTWWQQQRLRDPLVRQRLQAGRADPDEGIRSTCSEAFQTADAPSTPPASR